MLGATVKWIGGVTVAITLIISLAQLNSLFKDWQEREDAVNEFVQASNLWSKSGDYEGAWKLLDQALELKPSSRRVRLGQAMIAMEWLRDGKLEGERDKQRLTDKVDRLLPVLHRAATSKKVSFAADALAHIGWANYLRYLHVKRGGDPDEYFAQALTKDPKNLYAHIMWGVWVLHDRNEKKYDIDKLEKAKHHFSASLMSGKKTTYVKKKQLWALLRSKVPGADLELIKLLDQVRKAGEADEIIDKYLGHNFARAFLWIDGIHGIGIETEETEKLLTRLFTEIKPKDSLITFLWLKKKYIRDDFSLHRRAYYKYVLARLMEASGEVKTSLAHYTDLQRDLQGSSIYDEIKLKETVEKGIERVSGLQNNINGQ
jgi:tetratricopeptide (TPR) repeat protein